MGWDVVEVEGRVAAGLIALGFAQKDAQQPAAGQSRLPGSGARTVELPRRQVAHVSPPNSQQKNGCQVAGQASKCDEAHSGPRQ
jgi:hypothetical protein